MKGIIAFVLAAVAMIALPFMVESYVLSFMVQTLIFMALAYSWNLIGGYAGYPHFGQVAFFGLGCYVGALCIQAGVHWLVAPLVAAAFSVVCALILGMIMLRLNGVFFGIGMFGIARVCESLAMGFDGITQGGTGLYIDVVDLPTLYYVIAGIALVMLIITWRLDSSRLGLQLLTIREDETAANALGVRTTQLKVGTFAASALVPGAVGSLYVSYLGFIDPFTAFAMMTELTTIAMVLLGGLGTVFGPLVGVVALSVVNELLWARLPEVYLALVGIIILATILYMPRGIVAYAQRKNWPIVPTPRGHLRQLASRLKGAAK